MLRRIRSYVFPIRNGDYITTDLGFHKILNRHDPLNLGRVLTVQGWAYPYYN